MAFRGIILFLISNFISANMVMGQNYYRSLKEEVYVNSTADTIELNFSKTGEYTIYEGNSPETINWNKAIIFNGNKILLPRNTPRPFYGIITSEKDTLIVAERKLIINNLANFRDLGGLKNKDGKHIVWGKFYRSDALSALQTEKFAYLEGLGLKKVFDLRSDAEIAKGKDNLPKNFLYEHFPIFDNKNSGLIDGLEESLMQGSLSKEKGEELLLNMYKTFSNDYSEKFNSLIHQIMINDNYPNVFHCTAGKDRTGYTAAMILAILKVDKKTILDEYEMTNFYTENTIKELAANVEKLGLGDKISSETIITLMSVNRKYLEASFNIIDNEYGGIDAYIKNQLGISDAIRKQLIAKFTY